jgi:AraC-like DNA-binding protein
MGDVFFDSEASRHATQESHRDIPSVVERKRDDDAVSGPPACDTEIDGRQDACRVVGGLRISETVSVGGSVGSEAALPLADEGIFLILQADGRSLLLQGEATFPLEPGDLLLIEADVPLRRQTLGHGREVRVHLPRATIRTRVSMLQPAAPCLIKGDSGIGMVLRSLIWSLRHTAAPFCGREEAGIRDALVHLVAVACCARRGRCPERRVERPAGGRARDISLWQWMMLQRSIETLLPDPTLNPSTVAATHRISTRHLHRLFQQAGISFGSYVRARRLEHCRNDLTDARFEQLPLTEIAYRWGFSDSSHFSRCFKAAFGCTAREFRSRECGARGMRSRSGAGDEPGGRSGARATEVAGHSHPPDAGPVAAVGGTL